LKEKKQKNVSSGIIRAYREISSFYIRFSTSENEEGSFCFFFSREKEKDEGRLPK
jgi:hypothetical protein